MVQATGAQLCESRDTPLFAITLTASKKQKIGAADVERQIKLEQYKFEMHKANHTFKDLAERYIDSGILEHLKAAEDTLRRPCFINSCG
jgi:hypothetical protein